MKQNYLVDVPVRVMIWTRPDCQRKQFEVLKQARPSTLFLVSDGGRNEKEWEAIRTNRKMFDEEIDWDCTVYKVYEEQNNGLYRLGLKVRKLLWDKVDRCIFLEDDQIPAVSFFRYCAELLEKYKDDDRIQMICGNNPFVTYDDALPNDYFFTENGWSVWGYATWKRHTNNRQYPFDYADNEYIKRCLKSNLNEFWYEKVEGYCNGELVDNHIPGGEYFHSIESVLFHRMSIMPTRNMIKNIGFVGTHVNYSKKEKLPIYFDSEIYELDFPIKHPKYVIDDKHFGREYDKLLGHAKVNPIRYFFMRIDNFYRLILRGQAWAAIKNKFRPATKREEL